MKISIPEWVHVLPNKNQIKEHYLSMIRGSITNIEKVKDIDYINSYFENSEYITKSYISQLDAASGVVTINLVSPDSLYNEVLKETLGETEMTKASVLKMFSSFKEGREEFDAIKSALKMAKATGYGIMYPTTKDMKLTAPEVIKQGPRYGVKLKAVASSIHLVRVDVESNFEPIIGSEIQSKELIDFLMKDYEKDPTSIWKSEIFGRSLENVIGEGIKAKLSMMPDNTRFKLGDTITKIVNKGSNTLIAFVI
ncbi:MAG: stage IV sporulation protein A [bacterium]